MALWIGAAVLLAGAVVSGVVFFGGPSPDRGNPNGAGPNGVAGNGGSGENEGPRSNTGNPAGNRPADGVRIDPQWLARFNQCQADLRTYNAGPPTDVEDRMRLALAGRDAAQELTESAPPRHDHEFELRRLLHDWTDLAAGASYDFLMARTAEHRRGSNATHAMLAWTYFERCRLGHASVWPAWAQATRYTELIADEAASLKRQWVHRLTTVRDTASGVSRSEMLRLQTVIDQATTMMVMGQPTAEQLVGFVRRGVTLAQQLLGGLGAIQAAGEQGSASWDLLMGIQDTLGSNIHDLIRDLAPVSYRADQAIARQALQAASAEWMLLWAPIYAKSRRARWIGELMTQFDNSRPASDLPDAFNEREVVDAAGRLRQHLQAAAPGTDDLVRGLLELYAARHLRPMTPQTEDATARLLVEAFRQLADSADVSGRPEATAAWFHALFHLFQFAGDVMHVDPRLDTPGHQLHGARLLVRLARSGGSDLLDAGLTLACAKLRNTIRLRDDRQVAELVQAETELNSMLETRAPQALAPATHRQDAVFRAALCFMLSDQNDAPTANTFGSRALEHLGASRNLPSR